MSAETKTNRYSKESAYPVVEAWLQTAERKKDFCQAQGIPIYVLDYWLRKYKDEKAATPSTVSNFVPISLATSVNSYPSWEQIEITYGDGTAVRLPAHFSLQQLRSLLPIFSSADV